MISVHFVSPEQTITLPYDYLRTFHKTPPHISETHQMLGAVIRHTKQKRAAADGRSRLIQ